MPRRTSQDKKEFSQPNVSKLTNPRDFFDKNCYPVSLAEAFEEKELAVETYYDPKDLSKFANIGLKAPQLWAKFQEWYAAVFEPGALSSREKALIALAVSHVVQCPYCIDAYTKQSLEKGADTEQMTEAIHVAAAIKGGAALVHGVQMRNIVEKLTM